MKFRKVINELIEEKKDGVRMAGGVNAVIAGNVGESGSRTSVSSRQRIVQRGGKTEVFESEISQEGGTDDRAEGDAGPE